MNSVEVSKKYLHDRVVLILITLISLLLAFGVSMILLRFDVSKNPTTIVEYRPNISGSSYVSGKPIDIYSLAIFMLIISAAAVALSARIYHIRKYLAIFILAATLFLLLLTIRISWSIISLQ